MAAAILGFVFCRPFAALANDVGNPSFEESLGSSLDKTWDNTNGARQVEAGAMPGAFADPPDGRKAVWLRGGTFTFQIYDNTTPMAGKYVTFTVLAQADANGGGSRGDVKIEFKKRNPDNSDTTISVVSYNSQTGNWVSNATAPDGPGLPYVPFTVSAVAPPETSRIVATLTSDGAAASNIVYDKANLEVNPAKNLTVKTTKNLVKVGEPVMVHATFINMAETPINSASMVIKIPQGFNTINNTIRANGQKTETRNGSLIVSMGSLSAGQYSSVDFGLVATTGVTPGKYYDFDFFVRDGTGNTVSDATSLQLRVVADPVFDEGTILGKVFNDVNQNGVQDPGEKGVPYVSIATEYGVMVVTDQDGKYHIPAVQPGRHLIKVDGHSLPEGTQFVTEEAYLINSTPGILSKVSFAVLLPKDATPQEFKDDLIVSVTQGVDTSRPLIDTKMDREVLRVGLEMLEKQPIFKFQINYPDMIKNWFLEVRDELGQQVWTGFGVGAPPAEVMWSGKTESGYIIKPGLYSYQFKVQDNKGREDWGPLHFFRVVSKVESTPKEDTSIVFPEVGDFNIFKDGKQTIPLVAKPTVKIQGKTKPENKVKVNAYPVDVNPQSGDFMTELYVNPGKKEFVVEATTPEGETITYRKEVTVKSSTFFMVALGEEQLGYNFSGDTGTVGGEDTMKKAFYENGKLSYYVRGKLLGKFLVKSRYNTGDKRDVLFTNLNPDHYYPVYGDASKINYEGQDTMDRLYVLVEMDKSFAKWGSFKTDFRDTELASYNRTLSGLKIDYQTVGSTVYGDARRGFKLFWNKARYRAAHDEFGATGGSLYYLRNRLVLEGSEKIRVEVRDQIQDIPVQSTDLTVGSDYTIDYEEGRIILSRPLSSVASSDTISSTDPLQGNSVYLIVDYEYDVGLNVIDNKNHGIRGYTHLGDHIRVGGTAIQEERPEGNYELRGVDMTAKFGRNTKVTLEYATSQNQQTNQAVSYNGGLSFEDRHLLRGNDTKLLENAYLIKAESKPVKNFETSGYAQMIDTGFSNEHSASQEGTQKYGVAARYKFTDVFYLRYRFDKNDLSNNLRPPQDNGIQAPYLTKQTHTAQLVYDDGKYLGHLEYQNNMSKDPADGAVLPTLENQFPTKDTIAGKIGYRLNDRLMPYLRAQTTIDRSSYYAGAGLEYRIVNHLFAVVEEMFGNLGDATLFGLENHNPDGTRSYANIRLRDGGLGPQTLATTIGGSMPLTDHSRLYSERENSTYNGQNGYADIFGYQAKMGKKWDYDVKFERRRLKSSLSTALVNGAQDSLFRASTFNTIAAALGYADGDRLKARSTIELRRDYQGPSMWQVVTRQYFDYKLTRDLSYLAKLDYGISRFTGSGVADTPADFMELNTGFAYRPVDWDKFNALTRYTYTRNLGNQIQYYGYGDQNDVLGSYQTNETAHILAMDLAYDLHRYFGIVEKIGYKLAGLTTGFADEALLHTFLWGHRFNFHVTRKWDVALEYRFLFENSAADNFRQGPLVEFNRDLYDYVRLGVGYNFANFDDDLRKSNNYNAHGPFVRMSGKF